MHVTTFPRCCYYLPQNRTTASKSRNPEFESSFSCFKTWAKLFVCPHYLYPFIYRSNKLRQHYISSDSIHDGKYQMVFKINAHTCALIPVAPMTSYMHNPQGAIVGPACVRCMNTCQLPIFWTDSPYYPSLQNLHLLNIEDHFVFSSKPVKWIIKKSRLTFCPQVVDMRWGIRDEATDDHMTTELCMKEIETCQRLSVGPSFMVGHVTLLSNQMIVPNNQM